MISEQSFRSNPPAAASQLPDDAKSAPPPQEALLMEIRDLLKTQVGQLLFSVALRTIAGLRWLTWLAIACNLANMSLRLGGRAIRWDPEKEVVIGDKEAAAMCTKQYRAPWDGVLRSLIKV